MKIVWRVEWSLAHTCPILLLTTSFIANALDLNQTPHPTFELGPIRTTFCSVVKTDEDFFFV